MMDTGGPDIHNDEVLMRALRLNDGEIFPSFFLGYFDDGDSENIFPNNMALFDDWSKTYLYILYFCQ